MPLPSSSRRRYRDFVQAYRLRKLDDEKKDEKKDAPNETAAPGKRREYLRDYVRWLKPHRVQVAAVFVLALVAAGLQMVEPLFMRYMIDRVLLNSAPRRARAPVQCVMRAAATEAYTCGSGMETCEACTRFRPAALAR